jgi:hypothetical protein
MTKYEIRGINKYLLKKLGWDIEDPANAHIRDEFTIFPGDEILQVTHSAVASALEDPEISRWLKTGKNCKKPKFYSDLGERHYSSKSTSEKTIEDEDTFWKYIAFHIQVDDEM